jgi:stage III sporulation protein AC
MIMDVDIIFKIAGIGIAIAVINQILTKAGREDYALMTTLAGIVVVLFFIIRMISEFFETVKTLFQL